MITLGQCPKDSTPRTITPYKISSLKIAVSQCDNHEFQKLSIAATINLFLCFLETQENRLDVTSSRKERFYMKFEKSIQA